MNTVSNDTLMQYRGIDISGAGVNGGNNVDLSNAEVSATDVSNVLKEDGTTEKTSEVDVKELLANMMAKEEPAASSVNKTPLDKAEERDNTQTFSFNSEKDADKFWEELKSLISTNNDVYNWYSSGKGDDFSIGTYFKDPTSSNPSDECGKLGNVLESYSEQINAYMVMKYGFSEEYSKFVTDFIIESAVTETLSKVPFTPQNFMEDTKVDVFRGSWNFKDLMTNVINQVESIQDIKSSNGTTIKDIQGFGIDYIMQKYSYNKEFAQLVLDYISEKALSVETSNVQELVKNYLEIFDNLDEIVNPQCDSIGSMDILNYITSMQRGWDNTSSPLSASGLIGFMFNRVLGNFQRAVEYMYSDKTGETMKNWYENTEIYKFQQHVIDVRGNWYDSEDTLPIAFYNSFIQSLYKLLYTPEELEKHYSEYNAATIDDPAAPGLDYQLDFNSNFFNRLDSNNNNPIDEIYSLMLQFFKGYNEEADFILEHAKEYELDDYISKIINGDAELLNDEMGYTSIYSSSGEMIQPGTLAYKLQEVGIPFTVKEEGHEARIYSFTFNGKDYEIVISRKGDDELPKEEGVTEQEMFNYIEDKINNCGEYYTNISRCVSCLEKYINNSEGLEELLELINKEEGNNHFYNAFFGLTESWMAWNSDIVPREIAGILRDIYGLGKNTTLDELKECLQDLSSTINFPEGDLYEEKDIKNVWINLCKLLYTKQGESEKYWVNGQYLHRTELFYKVTVKVN